jgi:hypothetical protein
MAELYVEMHRGRRNNLTTLASALIKNDGLRKEMDEEEATAMIWRLASPELFLLLRDIEGINGEQYALWLEDSLRMLLLR